MKTPFCVAITIRQREVDQLKRAIAEALGALERRRVQLVTITAAAQAERKLASADWTLGGSLYFRRLGEQREQIVREAAVIEAELTALRGSATEAFASLSAIEDAATRWRSEERQRADAAEQSASDDRAASVHVRRAITGRGLRAAA